MLEQKVNRNNNRACIRIRLLFYAICQRNKNSRRRQNNNPNNQYNSRTNPDSNYFYKEMDLFPVDWLAAAEIEKQFDLWAAAEAVAALYIEAEPDKHIVAVELDKLFVAELDKRMEEWLEKQLAERFLIL